MAKVPAHRRRQTCVAICLVLIGSTARAEPEAPSSQPAGPASQPAPSSQPTVPPAADTSGYATVVRGKRPLARDVTSDALRVEGRQLRDSPRPTLLEAVSQQAADIYVNSRGGGLHGVANGASGGIAIRGLGGSPTTGVLVVEDGVPDYQGIFGHPIPDAYVPFLVDELVVVKGGDSVLYGTNAMGGAIVLRSRWRRMEGIELDSDTAYGSYGTLQERAALLARHRRWDLAGGVHLLKTDGHRPGAGGNLVVGTVGARYRGPGGLRATLRDRVVHTEGADPGPVTHPNADHWYEVWRNLASLKLESRAGRVALRMQPYLHLGEHRLYDGFRSLDVTTGGNVEASLPLHRVAALLAGVGAEWVDGDVENRITGERPRVEGQGSHSFYNQLTLRPWESLGVAVGTRLLYSTTYGAIFLYKAGVRWSLPWGLELRSRLARNFRQPTLRELYLPFPTANPDLRPERSLNLDVGLGLKTRYLTARCSVYRSEAEDLIRTFGAWPSTEVVNIDRITVWGIEGHVGLRRLGPLALRVSGGWQDVGRYTRQNPSAKLNAQLEAGHRFGAHRVGATLSGEWVHGLYMANYGRQPLADVFVMDLTLRDRYSFSGERLVLEPYLLLRNLLDRRYAYIEGYPMPGLHALGGLRMRI